MLDLLITGGKIIDGTGSAHYSAALGVDGEKVLILMGDTSSINAVRSIDATGCMVSPGFIDMHAHSAIMMLTQPRHEPKIRQGIRVQTLAQWSPPISYS